jgi:RNA polymerase sigma-70 factor (ECF subfamily)
LERPEREALQRDLERLADGDRAAFRPVFAAAWPKVRAVALRMMPHAADAEDAAQAALIKLFERVGEWDRRRDALAWIVGIAAYECMTIRKKRQRRREQDLTALAHVADGAPDPETRAIDVELEAAAVAVLGQLRPADRETLRVAFFGDVGEGAHAAAPATFRKRVERALVRLRAAWRDHGIG